MSKRNNPLYKYFTKEDVLGKSVAYYLRAQYPKAFWWHTVNEGKRTPLEQLKAVELGIRAGVSDILIICPNDKAKGLCLELKIKPNTCTESQKHFLHNMNEYGWHTAVVFTFEEAKMRIDEWFKLIGL